MTKITRTITVFSGVEVVADYKTRTFTEKPFEVYDKKDIPETAMDVKEEARLYVVSVTDFMSIARLAKEGETDA